MTSDSPKGKTQFVNHKLHIILVIISFGGWLPFYASYYLFCRLSYSTIEKRRSRRAILKVKRQEKRTIAKVKRQEKRTIAKKNRLNTLNYEKNLGYKKANFSGGQTYSLECSHQIRARKQTGLISRGLIGSTVWCEVCKEKRTVTGSIWAQH